MKYFKKWGIDNFFRHGNNLNQNLENLDENLESFHLFDKRVIQ